MDKDQYADTCEVTAASTGKSMPAEILYHEPGRKLDVAVNRAVKISMRYNGTCYEGRSAGMDFESSGPKQLTKTQLGLAR